MAIDASVHRTRDVRLSLLLTQSYDSALGVVRAEEPDVQQSIGR